MSSHNPRPDNESAFKIRRAVGRLDFALSLSRVEWDFFCTLTFKGSLPRIKTAYGMSFRWVRESANLLGVDRYRLLTALRGEHGERNGRFHFHCLMGGTSTRNQITDSHRLEHVWKQISNGGRVDVRPYVRALSGPEYLCKALGANRYEVEKFSLADSVTLSDSVIRLLTYLDHTTLRHCGEHTCKVGLVVNGSGGSTIVRCPAPVAFTMRQPLGIGQKQVESGLRRACPSQ